MHCAGGFPRQGVHGEDLRPHTGNETIVKNRTAHLLRCPYENVKMIGASPIAAGNFYGLAGTSAKELCRCAMDRKRDMDG